MFINKYLNYDLFEKKYKPKRVNKLLIDDHTINLLEFLIQVREINILFYGEHS